MSLVQRGANDPYRLAVVAKDLENVFFHDVGRGCRDRAASLTAASGVNVTCVFMGSPTRNDEFRQGNQTAIVEDLLLLATLEDGSGLPLDGMVIAVVEAEEGARLIEMVTGAGVPTITFDDNKGVDSQAYIGQSHLAAGIELANSLLRTRPEGGEYVIVDRSSNVIKEVAAGARARLAEEGSWREAVSVSPINNKKNGDIAHELIYDAIEKVPGLGAVICAGSEAIKDPFTDGWRRLVNDHRFRDVTFVVSSAKPAASELIKEGYIDSLVSAQPFVMGSLAIDKLYELAMEKRGLETAGFENGTWFRTPLVSNNVVGARFQNPTIENNYLGSLVIMGYVFFFVIVALWAACTTVVVKYRKKSVIRASQPLFLHLILFGALALGSAIIPLGFDDENLTPAQCSIACMAVPWLLSIGLNIIISALYAKTRRINMIMMASRSCRMVAITERDVIKPFALLMVITVTILTCWTVLAPADYARRPSTGTDHWNRTYKSFHGTCYDNSRALPYRASLYAVALVALFCLALEAFRARNVQTQYAESTYIAIVIFSLLQTVVLTTVILAIIDPQNTSVRYAVLVISIFIIDMATLTLIFIPKFHSLRVAMAAGASATSSNGGTEGLKMQSYKLQDIGETAMANRNGIIDSKNRNGSIDEH